MTPFDIPPWIMLSWLFVLGTVLGSFLNVCIHRIPQHESLWDQLRGLNHPPSRCPKCGARILLRDNIPIFGWLILRGRCRNCRAKFSPRYLLIEAFNGILFALVYWYEIPFGFNAQPGDTPLQTSFGPAALGMSPVAVLHWRYAYHMILFEALLVASFIDFDEMLIPDGSTLPAMLMGLVLGTAVPQVHVVPVWFVHPSLIQSYRILVPESWRGLLFGAAQPGTFGDGIEVPVWISQWPHLHGFAVSLTGLIVGGGLVWGVRILGSWVMRREAMGFGDVILVAMIGSFLGWQATVFAFFIAPVFALLAVVGSLLAGLRRVIPYGPYLSLGALAMVLFWPHLWPSAERLYQLGPFVAVMGVVMAALLVACLQLTQGVKWMLGIPLAPEDEVQSVWSSADTLTYLAAENHDAAQGRWRIEGWPGTAAGRGTAHEETWRRGSTGGGLGLRNGHASRPLRE